MMLPEHKGEFIDLKKNYNRKERPSLDSQQLEEFSRLIAESIHMDREIILTLFDHFEDRKITGKINKIDQVNKSIRIIQGNTFEWVYFKDIIQISSNSKETQ